MSTANTPAMERVEQAVGRYTALLFRHCYMLLGHEQDAQDTVQETFLRYIHKAPSFHDEEHEKAWLLTVATNLCRNLHRAHKAHPHTDLESLPERGEEPTQTPLLEALRQLPVRYRTVLVLHYVQGYKVREIAAMLRLTASAVKMRLQKGRRLLEQAYKEE